MSTDATAPDRSARQACWDGRDAYFECLTRNNEDQGACSREKVGFEKNCAASWVDYFVKRRVLQKRQDAMYARDAGNMAAAAAEKAKMSGTGKQ